jgi:hypothetical protein
MDELDHLSEQQLWIALLIGLGKEGFLLPFLLPALTGLVTPDATVTALFLVPAALVGVVSAAPTTTSASSATSSATATAPATVVAAARGRPWCTRLL